MGTDPMGIIRSGWKKYNVGADEIYWLERTRLRFWIHCLSHKDGSNSVCGSCSTTWSQRKYILNEVEMLEGDIQMLKEIGLLKWATEDLLTTL